MSCFWKAGEELVQIPLKAPCGIRFERLAHQHDVNNFGGRQILSDVKGRQGRDGNSLVGTDPARQQITKGPAERLIAEEEGQQDGQIPLEGGDDPLLPVGNQQETAQQNTRSSPAKIIAAF